MKIPAALALAGLISLGAAAPGFAQQPQPGAPGAPGAPAHRAQERPLPGRYIEGRIAFLRAELKITESQAPLWDRYAAVMRSNAAQANQSAEQRRAGPAQPPVNAADRLVQRARFAEAQATAAKASADAFTPLYASLTDEQKKMADELMARGGGGGREHGPGMAGHGGPRHEGPHHDGPRHH